MTPLDEAHPSDVVRFAVFEVDLRSGELRKSGVRIKLQDQPFRLLRILLDHPGDVVTREELQRQIWPSDTFVDFDRGLNNAVKRLREALGDEADTPRYIETLPKRGYRFIGTLRDREDRSGTVPERPAGTAPPKSTRRVVKVAVGALALAILLSAIGLAANVDGLRDLVFPRSTPPVVAPGIHSLAVIPLTNLSADSAQDYFSDGLTDALITELAQIRTIRVISRTSVMRYKKTDKTLAEIARELNVDGIVEGTIQRSGDRVRITARLIQATSDKHIWAHTYERNLTDVFALERELTEEIARQVQARLGSPDQSPPIQPRPVNVEALEAYLQGKQHLDRWGRGFGDAEKRTAADYFQRAVAIDPDFAQAYLGLSEAHYYLLCPLDEDWPISRKAMERFVALDPNSPMAALDVAEHAGDMAAREQAYRRAVALHPNSPDVHERFSQFLDGRGRLDEGWKELEITQQLDPSRGIFPSFSLPNALELRGQSDRAIELLTHLDNEPGDGQTHLGLSSLYEAKGMDRESIEELGRTAASYGFPDIAPRLRRAFDASGYRGGLRQWARELEHYHATKQVYYPNYLAAVYADLGDTDHVFQWLEESYKGWKTGRERSGMDLGLIRWLEDTKSEPKRKFIRADRRYLALLRRVGLSP
jgi:TolB-like protein/DNA-binding winged helix-turn-helix (wHTH) protein/tetratricopeptide (TPR) repeat protein